MEFINLINQFPVWFVILYLGIESIKAYLPYRQKKKHGEEHTKDEVTDAVFDMYNIAKSNMEIEKEEIRSLTKTLRRANLEITILERKLAAMMRIMDSIFREHPETYDKYLIGMHQYKEEIEDITNNWDKSDV